MRQTQSGFLLPKSIIKLFENSDNQSIKKLSEGISEFNSLMPEHPELAILYSRKIIIGILQHISCTNEIGHRNFSLIELSTLCFQKNLINAKAKSTLENLNQLSEMVFSMYQFPIGFTTEKKLHPDEICLFVSNLKLFLLWFAKHTKSHVSFERTYFNLSPELMTPSHFAQICELEKKYPPQFRTSSDTIHTWHKHNPDIYTVITDVKKKNVIGLIEALPLNDDYSNRLYKSELNDVEIPVDAIMTFDKPCILKLYISSVIIDEFYYNSDIFIFMFDAFLKKLLKLARKGIYFSEVFADIINPQGRKIARYWEMEKIIDTPHGSAIYKLTLIPPSLEELLHITDHKTAESLNFYYERKFKELQEVFDIIL